LQSSGQFLTLGVDRLVLGFGLVCSMAMADLFRRDIGWLNYSKVRGRRVKRVLSEMLSVFLLTCLLVLAFSVQPARAAGAVYIRADGSINPLTAPIRRDRDVYTLTGDISSDANLWAV
jgi:hypothetical protein